MEEWLEVADSLLDRTRISGDESFIRACRLEEAVPDGEHWPVLPRTWTGSSVSEAPEDLREILLRRELSAALNPREDRVAEISLKAFESDRRRVTYSLCDTQGTIEIQGWNHHVIEDASSQEPFRRRLRRLTASAAGALGFGLLILLWYGARHAYFRSTPNFPWLGELALLLALAVLPFAAALSLPRRSLHASTLLAAGLPLLLTISTQATVAASGGPTVEHARARVREGRPREALLELSACAALSIDASAARALHDDLLVREAEAIQDPAGAWKAVSLPFLTSSGRSRAEEHALSLIVRDATVLQERDQYGTAAVLLDQVPDALRRDERIRALERQDHIHRAEMLWKRIRSRDSVLDSLAACREVQAYLEDLDPATKDRINSDCIAAETRGKQESARREREEKRQREAEERERRQAEKAAAAAQRAWDLAPLLCRDGTLSPSCICGSSSHRGCCSHHGGVEGCSKEWPR